MNTQLFTKMLSDKNFFDLHKMQYKYGLATVQELTDFLYRPENNITQKLPICDFYGTPLVYQPHMAQINLRDAKKLMDTSSENILFSQKEIAAEIRSSLAIENIYVSEDSIHNILQGQTPNNIEEFSIQGMHEGLNFISDIENHIHSETLYALYQIAIGNYLPEDCNLLKGHLYRHDSVCIVGGRTEHQGLSAEKLPSYMDRLLNFIALSNEMNDLHKASVIHFYLAYLHPYFDGNGRTARLLHLWYLIQCGYPALSFLPFSSYIEQSQSSYYKAFSQIESNAKISGVLDITPFLCYVTQNVYNYLIQK